MYLCKLPAVLAPIANLFAVFVLALPLLGCAAIQRIEERGAAFSVGAVPLDFVDVSPNGIGAQWATFRNSLGSSLGTAYTPTKKDYLGFVASVSEARCADFLTGLVVASNSTHLGLDMLTTVFSALGTAFSPIATVHALTAAATISSGWRADIDSDIYARLAIQDMLQAIQGTYYTQMASYISALPYLDEAAISIPAELTKVQTIHASCTLASARGTVRSSLASPSQVPPGPTDTATLTIGFVSGNAALAGDTIQFAIQSPTIVNVPRVPIFINVSKGNNASDIASRIADAINNLNLSGVSAKVSGSATSVTISLISQASDKVTWSPPALRNSGNSKISITYSPAPAQPVVGTPAGQPAAAVVPAK